MEKESNPQLRKRKPSQGNGYPPSKMLTFLAVLPLGILFVVAAILMGVRCRDEAVYGLIAWGVAAVGLTIALFLWSRTSEPNMGVQSAVAVLANGLLYFGPGLFAAYLIFGPFVGRPAPIPPPIIPAGDGWTEFEDPEKKFRIEFPGKPSKRIEQLPNVPQKITTFDARDHNRQSEYALGFIDIPAEELALVPREIRLDGARDGMLKKLPPGSRVASEQAIIHEGYHGREIVFGLKVGTMKAWLFFVGNRFYIVNARVVEGPNSQDMKRFLESFRPFTAIPSPTAFPGLLASWSFDEDEGPQALDGTGNNNHSRLHNATRVSGRRGKAVELKGDGFIDFGTSSQFDFDEGAPFTIAGWFKSIRMENASLVSLRATKGLRAGKVFVNLSLNPEGLTSECVAFHDLEGLQSGQATIKKAFSVGNWQHLALTHAPDRSPSLWIDGTRVAGGKSASGALRTDERRLGLNFSGLVDEICIFNRVLDSEELQALAGKRPGYVERKAQPAPVAQERNTIERPAALLGRLSFADQSVFTSSLFYSADSRKIIAGLTKPPNTAHFDDGLQIWDADKHVLLHKAVGSGHIRLAARGRLILFAHDQGVQVYDADEGKILPLKFPGPQGRAVGEHFCLSPDESFLLLIERDFKGLLPKTTLRKFSFKTGELQATWQNRVVFGMPVIHPGNECFAYATDKTVQICSTSTGEVLQEIALGVPRNPAIPFIALAFSPDGRELAIRLPPAGLALLNLENKKVTPLASDPRFSGSFSRIVYTPNGKYLLAADSTRIHAIEAASKKVIRSWSTRSSIFGLAVSPDGKQLAIARPRVTDGPAPIQLYDLAAALGLDESEARLLGVTPPVAALPDHLRAKAP